MGEIRLGAGKRRPIQQRRLDARAFGEAKRSLFFDALAATCSVRAAAGAAGVHNNTVYRHRRGDPAFAARWDQALAIGYDDLEAAAVRYALDRLDEEADPDAAPVTDGVATKLRRGDVNDADLRFALALLRRHRAAATGARRSPRVARATEAETDAALHKLLDDLERRKAS